MTYGWIVTSLAALALCACDAENKDGELLDGTGGTDGTGTSSGAESSGSGSGTTSSGGTSAEGESSGSETGSGSSSTGATPPPRLEPETCAAITDPETCESTISYDNAAGEGAKCEWETWVEVSYADGVCSYGTVESGCAWELLGFEGCASWTQCGGAQQGAVGRFEVLDDGTVRVGSSPEGWCLGSGEGFCNADTFDPPPPECDCICGGDWPGVAP